MLNIVTERKNSMASPSQLAANLLNAQSSTGPRTPEGKARVSQNALRHGLTATHLVILSDEQQEFDAFQNSLIDELAPEGAIETVTFHELLHAAWNLQRYRRIEAESSIGTAADFTDPATIKVLDRLSRYQARTQRAYYKALQELRILQTNRALRATKLREEAADQVPVIADINHLTKQTHSEVTSEALTLAVRMMEYETGTFQLNALKNSKVQPTSSSASKT
jgi:hypothetical protein